MAESTASTTPVCSDCRRCLLLDVLLGVWVCEQCGRRVRRDRA